MNIYGVYFSPTGGTKKILDILINEWEVETKLIDLTVPKFEQRYELSRDDICMVAIPSYGGRVPEIVLKRLAHLKGDYTRTVLIVVYGNRAYDDTLLELKNTLKDNGFNPVAAISAVAKHAIINQFAYDRPNAMDEMQLQVFSKEIINLITNKEKYNKLKVPGNFPYRKYKSIPLKPKGINQCHSCGLCARSCPTQAISIDCLKLVDKSRCISCMRCVHICPNHARAINPLILKIASKMMEKSCSLRKENQLFFEVD